MNDTIRRRHLPHWDVPGATFFVTSCLYGSLPMHRQRALDDMRRQLDQRPRPARLSQDEWERRKSIALFRTADGYLDREPTQKWLAKPELAAEVRKSLYHFAGDRYDVFAYVTMPSHLHWVFRPAPAFEATLEGGDRTAREYILHSLKLWTARQCNALLGRSGTFWQQESYDHWARDDRELYSIIRYVEQNPVKAGLALSAEEWPWSSAHDRKLWGIEEGLPLRPPPPPVG